MQLVMIVDGDVTERDPRELEELLRREDGVVWVDMVAGSEETRTVLSDVFGARPSAVHECEHPGLVPRVRRYADHILIELHAPAVGPDGLVDGVAMNQFVGRRYVVTVHELRDGIEPEELMRDTTTVLRRLNEGRAQAGSAAQLAHAVATAVVDTMELRVRELSDRVVKLEREILHGRRRQDQRHLESMFRARHELVTVQTMATHNRAALQRLARIAVDLLPDSLAHVEDAADQFARVQSMCAAERDFLQELLDLYQTRATDSINVAMERLALISAVALPVTAVASVYGMNTIVNAHTRPVQLVLSLVSMSVLTGAMLIWARRQGWW